MLGNSESAPAPAVMWRKRLRAHFMTAHYAVSAGCGKLSPLSRWGARPLMAQSGQFIRSFRRRLYGFGVWYGRAKNSAVNNAVDKNAINSRRPI